MTLRKITIDNSVNSTAQSEQTQKIDGKPKTMKKISSPRRQSKNISQNNKKFGKIFITGERHEIIE